MPETNAANDADVRRAILHEFYSQYLAQGLYVIVPMDEVTQKLGLSPAQARRCFDYLSAKGLIRLMTRGGGYRPTVDLVDQIEAEGQT